MFVMHGRYLRDTWVMGISLVACVSPERHPLPPAFDADLYSCPWLSIARYFCDVAPRYRIPVYVSPAAAERTVLNELLYPPVFVFALVAPYIFLNRKKCDRRRKFCF